MFKKTTLQTLLFSLLILLEGLTASADQPDIESYGKLPEIRELSISPDGKHIAYIRRIEEIDYFFVANIEDNHKVVHVGDTSKFKARSTVFPANKYAILFGSDVNRTASYRFGPYEKSGAMLYDLEAGKTRSFFKDSSGILANQTGLGKIAGFDESGKYAYMPAFEAKSGAPYSLFRVSLNTGRAVLHAKGGTLTIDWFVDSSGNVLAREDFSEKHKEHRIYSKTSGEWQLIYNLKTDAPEISVRAVGVNNKSLLFIDLKGKQEGLYRMSLENGDVSGPLYSSGGRDVDSLLTDIDRKFIAIIYGGIIPDYEFAKELDNEAFNRLLETFPMSAIDYTPASRNRNLGVVKVSGLKAADAYYIYNSEEGLLTKIGSGYQVESIASYKAVRYEARDGLKIPAILTFPLANDDSKNLPLIVLPHDRPDSHDQIGFHWMAQFFAAKGYMVLQPNFRGSTGFGHSFHDAGKRKWGQEMQNDVTDGVNALVEAGFVDPSRICIIGKSYGGYSALAGGAFTPDLYRCVVSINGISDVPAMLGVIKRKYGSDHWYVSHLKSLIGDSKHERDKMEEISPVHHAESFAAPVLMIHGEDDTFISIKQSERMVRKLKKAGKDAKLIKLKGEDHWLSTSSARLQALQAMSDFLDLHNPAN